MSNKSLKNTVSSEISSLRWTKFISELRADYPKLSFKSGYTNHWSPEINQIIYDQNQELLIREWSLLHELAHATLTHTSYSSDFELLKLEVRAWEKAKKLASKYSIVIDEEHVQNCLDTYRDWLHKRSTCPTCSLRTTQKDDHTYECFNCRSSWQVSNERFARSYRKIGR